MLPPVDHSEVIDNLERDVLAYKSYTSTSSDPAICYREVTGNNHCKLGVHYGQYLCTTRLMALVLGTWKKQPALRIA